MNWNRNDPFGKGKKETKQKKAKWSDEDFTDGTYYAEFMKDW